MLTRRTKAYSTQFILSVRCSRRSQKINKTPYFGSSGVFKIIDADTTKKLVTIVLLKK